MTKEIPKEIKLGTRPLLKLSSGENQDQVKLPRVKATAPKKMN